MQLFSQPITERIVSLVLLSARRAGILIRGAVLLECAKAARAMQLFKFVSQANMR
jgi:hypothetical protein